MYVCINQQLGYRHSTRLQ